MLKTKEEIKNWLDRYDIENYTINEDLTVDVDGDVDLNNKCLKIIPIKFNKVNGNFYCFYNNLTSLEFAPKKVGGDFDCSSNKLTSLEFAPEEIKCDFYCNNNMLISLEFAPKKVNGNFFWFYNSFINNIYNESNQDKILEYLKNEELKKELDKEIINKVVVKRVKI